MEKNELGLLQVYTGDGKGKTTAAMGLALRAWGHGLRICVIQFMKKGEDYGEVRGLRKMDVDVFQFGSGKLIVKGRHCQDDLDCARHALEFSRETLASGEYDLVILDEVNVAVYFDLISCDDAINMLRKRDRGVEVVCTGRNAPEELKREADLVTVMVVEKHPYDGGLEARKGIEY
ncbi:MAG TPA: cob(I)yrinic acid a,c-diamide adenosyltransferase [Methanomassiliicoccales archaeon]|nr:cob(I)yrinic acid a,c-diamide adenosyltransferase [Methanomassiliicoccales archaeon]